MDRDTAVRLSPLIETTLRAALKKQGFDAMVKSITLNNEQTRQPTLLIISLTVDRQRVRSADTAAWVMVDYRCPYCDRCVIGDHEIADRARKPSASQCQHCKRPVVVKWDDADDLTEMHSWYFDTPPRKRTPATKRARASTRQRQRQRQRAA